jgi:CheY-like chemotaxis protein
MSTILIIDDDPGDIRYISALLLAAGHQTIAATTGIEGLRATDFEPPDLILCDVMMPRMNGYETLKQLKTIPGIHRIPVVAVTGLNSDEDRLALLAAGFDGHFFKPVPVATFVADLEEYLRKAQASNQNASMERTG